VYAVMNIHVPKNIKNLLGSRGNISFTLLHGHSQLVISLFRWFLVKLFSRLVCWLAGQSGIQNCHKPRNVVCYIPATPRT
jgi:hypothetical protein